MKNILISILILSLISCESLKKDDTDFLNFRLGMSKKEYEKERTKLFKENKFRSLPSNFSGFYNWYVYNLPIGDESIPVVVDFSFKFDELREISVSIGKIKSGRLKVYFETTENQVDKLLSLYKTKYGTPDSMHTMIYSWEKVNKEISFFTGSDNGSHYDGAFILYSYDKDFEEKLDKKAEDELKKEKEKAIKKSIDNI